MDVMAWHIGRHLAEEGGVPREGSPCMSAQAAQAHAPTRYASDAKVQHWRTAGAPRPNCER